MPPGPTGVDMGATPDDRTIDQEAADAEANGRAEPNGGGGKAGRFGRTPPRAGDSRGPRAEWRVADAASRAATRKRDVPWWVQGEESAPVDPARALAAFYDRRAPAALAYCARVCEPESIADAVEEAFGKVFAT